MPLQSDKALFVARLFLKSFFVLLKAQDDYVSQLHVKFNEIQQYAVSTEEVRNWRPVLDMHVWLLHLQLELKLISDKYIL